MAVKSKLKEPSGVGSRYVCIVCGYIYDPKKGDPHSGAKAGTPFSNLPADWICPVCGADKSHFEAVSAS